MKSRFITDPQDPSDGFLNTAGAEVYTNFFRWAGNNAGSSFAKYSGGVIEKLRLLRVKLPCSFSAQSGPTSALAMSSGGITIQSLVRCRGHGRARKFSGWHPAGGIDTDVDNFRPNHGQHQNRL